MSGIKKIGEKNNTLYFHLQIKIVNTLGTFIGKNNTQYSIR